MDTAEAYRAFFASWPKDLPVEGNIVTSLNETIQFVGFALSAGLLIVERDKPDSYGSRKVVLGYDQIAAVKLPSPADLSAFQAFGFKQL